MPGISALLLGGTGETGKELVKQLLLNERVKKVILVGRRKVENVGNKRDDVVSCLFPQIPIPNYNLFFSQIRSLNRGSWTLRTCPRLQRRSRTPTWPTVA